MTVRIGNDPFTNDNPYQWRQSLLGPAWVELHRENGRWWFMTDIPVCRGIRRFIRAALDMAGPDVRYGTVYAAELGGGEVTAGGWHYDLGEYRPDGADRFVGTWASDGTPLQNAFSLDGEARGSILQPPNNYVVAFNEGTDYHRREPVPARPDAWGAFVSLALYRDHEPANLECPRLANLRTRGPRAEQAKLHAVVARTTY